MGRKWNNIKEKKASKDTNTSRINAKFGRELYVAAKQGEPDPETNQTLKFVIERAKTYNVPKSIIDRAIEKAKGGSDEVFDSFRYEGFGQNGTMIIVDALTNNINRTVAEVRSAFTKNDGNMGVSGSVAYMFNETAVFGVEGKTEDEILELLIEANIEIRDIMTEEEAVIIYAEPNQFNAVQTTLSDMGINEFTIAELTMLAQNDISLANDALTKFEKLIDALEDLDDVQQVYHNVELE